MISTRTRTCPAGEQERHEQNPEVQRQQSLDHRELPEAIAGRGSRRRSCLRQQRSSGLHGSATAILPPAAIISGRLDYRPRIVRACSEEEQQTTQDPHRGCCETLGPGPQF
jgi:hypothetical protein